MLTDDGDLKDDVKMPDEQSELGKKLKELHDDDSKDVSKYTPYSRVRFH